jgi:RNA polymerase sigma factor (sigma-70 family)
VLEIEQEFSIFFARMVHKLIYLLEKCRRAPDQASRESAFNELYDAIRVDLYLYTIRRSKKLKADDVVQEVWKAISTNLHTFKEKTDEQFLSWCYRIARNKAADSFRDRNEPMPLDEVTKIIDESENAQPMSAQDRLDLEHAMNLLSKAKPECLNLLWNHYVLGLDIQEIASQIGLKYDAARMKINRCLDAAQGLI